MKKIKLGFIASEKQLTPYQIGRVISNLNKIGPKEISYNERHCGSDFKFIADDLKLKNKKIKVHLIEAENILDLYQKLIKNCDIIVFCIPTRNSTGIISSIVTSLTKQEKSFIIINP
jgi:uncharacterized protein (UPF0335 family)